MICHKHKCIFIHVTKCAGSSIESAFGINLDDPVGQTSKLFGRNRSNNLNLQHATPQQLLDNNLITREQFDSYYKFIVIRNPWDRIVSGYNYILRMNKKSFDTFYNFLGKNGKFHKRMNDSSRQGFFGYHLTPQKEYFFLDGVKIKYDLVIDFENIDHGFKTLINDLKLPSDFFDVKQNVGKQKTHYSYYFNKRNKDLFKNIYKEDIYYFNYEFENRANGFKVWFFLNSFRIFNLIKQLIRKLNKKYYNIIVLFSIKRMIRKNQKNSNPKKIEKSNVPVYYINLHRSIERKKQILHQLTLNFSNYNRINAVDGRLLKPDCYNNKTDFFQYDLSDFVEAKPEEIGCTLSHMEALRKIHEDGCEFALVLEDDVSFKYRSQWGLTIDEIIKNAPKDFEVLKLHGWPNKQEGNINLLRKGIKYRKIDNIPHKEWSTAAMIWSKKGIENMMRFFCNDFLRITRKDTESIIADYFIWRVNKSYDFTQPLIYQNEFDSLIQTGSYRQQLNSNKIFKKLY